MPPRYGYGQERCETCRRYDKTARSAADWFEYTRDGIIYYHHTKCVITLLEMYRDAKEREEQSNRADGSRPS